MARSARSAIDAIWLSPIHPSPGFDVGYDVADYDAIDPVFGTLDDFDRLVAESHRRGIRVMLDLVMNHSSSAHRWFEESRRDPSGPFGDCYLWRDAKPGRLGRRGPPEQLAIVLRRLGLDLGRDPRPVLHAHLPARAARPQLAQPGRSRGDARRWSAAGSTGVSTASGSTSSTRSSSTPSLLSNPRRMRGSPALRPAGPPLRQGPAGAARLPGRVPGARRLVSGADVRRRAVRVGPDGRCAAQRAPATWSSTGTSSASRGGRREFAEASDEARADVRGRRLADARPVEPRPAAAGEPPGAGRGSPRRATRWRVPPPS